jgi:tetratricopeptide (TPR) repeat protein
MLPLLLLLLQFQLPQDTIRQHYEAAEAHRGAGNLAAAESEYKVILAEGYGRLGKIYSARGEYKEAITTLEAATLYSPDSQEVLIDTAIAYFGLQQYEKAVEPLRKALAQDPQNVGAHQMLGKTYFMIGDVTKSITELETALKLAPNDVDVAYTLGIAYLRDRQFAAAKQLYGQMPKQFGDQPQLHIVIGRAYREAGLYPEAIEEFKQAVALDPNFPRGHYYLGLTYLLNEGQSRLSDAREEFKIELAANPDEFFANYYLGVTYIFERKWDQAISVFLKASQIQPNNPDPYFQLGQAYQELGKHEQAIEVLKKSIALTPFLAYNKYQVATAHHRLSQSLIKSGQAEAGQQELQLASELKAEAVKAEQASQAGPAAMGATRPPEQGNSLPEIGSVKGSAAASNTLDEKTLRELKDRETYYKKVIAAAHNDIGLLRAEQQDYHAAAEQFLLASKWNLQQEGVDYNLGLAYFKTELFKEAAPPLENELKAHPANIRAKWLLGMCYFMTNNYHKASELLGDLVNSKSTDIGLYYALASSLIKEGKNDAAENVINRMSAMTGNTPQLHLLRGQISYEENNAAKAMEEFVAALTLDNNVRQAHYYSGLTYLKMGKFDEAALEFDKELVLNPKDLQAKYQLGILLLKRNDIDGGIRVMREVILAWPDHADARYELGKALFQKGDLKGALENLEIAAKLDPEKPDVHYQLGRAYISVGRPTEGKNQIEISKRLKDKARSQKNH